MPPLLELVLADATPEVEVELSCEGALDDDDSAAEVSVCSDALVTPGFEPPKLVAPPPPPQARSALDRASFRAVRMGSLSLAEMPAVVALDEATQADVPGAGALLKSRHGVPWSFDAYGVHEPT